MLNTDTYLPPIRTHSNQQNRTKAIVFRIHDYYFALPLEAIIKIIPCPKIASPIREGLGLVEWDRQTITVVDLADRLQVERSEDRSAEHCLILTQTISAELCGFLIEESPMLMDIPWDSIRSVPLSYRQVADLSVIKQMAILPPSDIYLSERKLSAIENSTDSESAETLKIFLLGEWNKFS